MHKRAIVIGGGIAGIQSALDLGDMGIETFLVEKSPSIGGRMAQLDKTFPTNDCAMCILSPKLVEAGSHPYITILSNTEVLSIEGTAPNLKVKLLKKTRYIKEEICTGCGICITKCPEKIKDSYNKNLSTTKCIHIPFAQAIPAIPIIDKESCRFFKTGKCRICEKFCEMNAIDFEQKDKIIELEAGSVIMASGSQEFDAKLKNEYGYKLFPNVITSIEFERLLSASGPTGGHVIRPSDNKEPKKIAMLQCVGSRDEQAGNDYCSAICCMQAAKHAIIVQEHIPDVKTSIFYMDIRAYGKEFDKFIDRAESKHKTRFIRARISSVEQSSNNNDNLLIQYITQEGIIQKEEFDLLVLSVGLEPSISSRESARRIGISVDSRGFVVNTSFAPINSDRDGIFICGSISGPKDIPESVMEASGAASGVATVLNEFPKKKISIEYPIEKELKGQGLRIGVFVCRCGINIASTVDVPNVVEYISKLPNVKHSQELLFACAQDSQKQIKEAINGKNLTRIVVSACTPRTHEPLFQKTLKEAGLNPYVFEFANIREHCSWVHQNEKEKATEKAKDLIKSSIAKVCFAEPLYKKSLDLNKDVLVIGGGLSGMICALDLAKQGYQVHIIEKENELGGNMRHVKTTLKGEATEPVLSELIEQIKMMQNIKIYLSAKIKEISGFIGNFTTKLDSPEIEINHGIIIIASGADENNPDEYLLGKDSQVVTQRNLENLINNPDKTLVKSLKRIVMIQCVGSRDDEHLYCSRVCCSQAIKNAIRLKELNTKLEIYILYRDIRTYGLKERFYKTAREKNIIFIRYEKDKKPEVFSKDGNLQVKITDKISKEDLLINPDLVVLSTGIVPNPMNKELSQFLKVPLNQDGFFLEAHAKLRPVDFATDGIFVCGLAHYPKDISETIAQAHAAAGRAATILSKDNIEAECRVSYIREERCSGCKACLNVCAYNAIEFDDQKHIAIINEALCKGCGVCSATCRSSAIDIKGFKNEQILAALAAL